MFLKKYLFTYLLGVVPDIGLAGYPAFLDIRYPALEILYPAGYPAFAFY